MTVIKRVQVEAEQLDELLVLGDRAKMGFATDTDAVRWAIREGCDKLLQSIVTRQAISRDDAVPAEAC